MSSVIIVGHLCNSVRQVLQKLCRASPPYKNVPKLQKFPPSLQNCPHFLFHLKLRDKVPCSSTEALCLCLCEPLKSLRPECVFTRTGQIVLTEQKRLRSEDMSKQRLSCHLDATASSPGFAVTQRDFLNAVTSLTVR